jgi:hypothetical protein
MSVITAASAPAEIIGSPRMPEDMVRHHLTKAIHACLKTQYRLMRLASIADRERRWENGAEYTWFFTYSDRKLLNLRHIFPRICEILQSPKLRIVCDEKSPHCGVAIPLILHIKLGSGWLALSDEEKTQTLIHEASHIAGRVVIDEGRWYGEEKARRMARWTYRRPMRALRSAENLGYYAMDVYNGLTAGIFA